MGVKTEREFRFELPSGWSAAKLIGHDIVGKYINDIKQFDMRCTDFDIMPGRQLKAAGRWLRLREENGKPVFTLKVSAGTSDDSGEIIRREYEIPDETDFKRALSRMREMAVESEDVEAEDTINTIATKLLTEDVSTLIIRIRKFVRVELDIKFRDAEFEISVDTGYKYEPDGTGETLSTPIQKVEVEYVKGNPQTFIKYVDCLEFITGMKRVILAE